MTTEILKKIELHDQSKAIEHLNQALQHFGKDDFLFTLHNIAIVQGVTEIANKTGLSREGLYKILQPSGNPRLSVLLPIMEAMGLWLQVIDKPNYFENRQLFRVARFNSLAQTFPNVAFHWHPEKNAALTANDITANSRKMIWWCCFNSHNKPLHEWKATPISLIKKIKDNLYNTNIFTESAFTELLKKICPHCT